MSLIIAMVGDVHGLHHTMVRTLTKWSRRTKTPIDLVLQVGDFEPHRHQTDLRSMSAPSKYKRVGDFPDFYEGRAQYPWPVYFIGGNHEPYGWLDHYPDGFELMDNCHYLGRSGVREVMGLRVGFLTGIFEPSTHEKMRPPVEIIEHQSNRAYIDFKQYEVDQLLEQADAGIDILLVHDWPRGLIHHQLWAMVRDHTHRQTTEPGNEGAQLVVELLEPQVIAAGHMHMRLIDEGRYENEQPYIFAGLDHMRAKDNAVAFIRWDGQQATLL